MHSIQTTNHLLLVSKDELSKALVKQSTYLYNLTRSQFVLFLVLRLICLAFSCKCVTLLGASLFDEKIIFLNFHDENKVTITK